MVISQLCIYETCEGQPFLGQPGPQREMPHPRPHGGDMNMYETPLQKPTELYTQCTRWCTYYPSIQYTGPAMTASVQLAGGQGANQSQLVHTRREPLLPAREMQRLEDPGKPNHRHLLYSEESPFTPAPLALGPRDACPPPRPWPASPAGSHG